MIVIKEDKQYIIKLKQRIEFSYDFDEDSWVYDDAEMLDKFNEEADKIVSNKQYLSKFFDKKISYIKGIDFSITDAFAQATVYLNKPMSRSDVEFFFNTFIEEVISDMPDVYVSLEGDSEYDDFDPSTEYGYVSKSKHTNSDGTASISAVGNVQIEYNK